MDGLHPRDLGRWPSRLTAALRDADWLTADRARAYAGLLLLGPAVVAAGWFAMASGWLDATGTPVGADFAHYWDAGRLALQGRPAAAWDVPTLFAAQKAWLGPELFVTPFLYPPPFLVLLMPFALLPYGWALLAWLGATGAAYAAVYRRLAGGWLPVLTFPAIFINATHGQNGFLTAALFGGAALLHGRHPALSGVCLGLLSFKPHLGIPVIAVLLAARRWTTIAAAAATVGAIYGGSLLVLGWESAQAFLHALPMGQRILAEGLIEANKVASLFGAVVLLGGGPGIGFGAQVAGTACVIAAAALVAWRRPGGAGEVALMAAAAPLCSPYLFQYDLTILALPLAFVFVAAQRDGFRPWEKVILAAAFVIPLAGRPLASELGLPATQLCVAALFVVVLRRVAYRSRWPGA